MELELEWISHGFPIGLLIRGADGDVGVRANAHT
jgi:hypothetical protein